VLGAVPAEALEACFEWIYTGTCVAADDRALRGIVEAAIYLQIGPLVDVAIPVISSRLSVDTVLSTWRVADSYGLEDLSKSAVSAACMHFNSLTARKEWLSVPEELAHVLLSDNRLRVRSEEEVYTAAVAWLRAREPTADPESVAAMLALVRFKLVSQAFVRETVMKEPLLLSMPQELLLGMFANLHGSTTPDNVSSRNGGPRLFAIGGSDGGNNLTNSVECYDPFANAWNAAEPMITTKAYTCGAVMDGKAYVAGGRSSTVQIDYTSSVHRFDQISNTWEEIESLNEPRNSGCAAVLQGKLYVAGGVTGDLFNEQVLASVEYYQSSEKMWEKAPRMRMARRGAGAAVIGGKLYVAGGFNGNVVLDSVERYDPSTNSWEYVGPMRNRRWYHVVAELDGKLYVAGGLESRANTGQLRSVERYDPATNTWETVAPMRHGRYLASAAVLDGKLYVTSGSSSDVDIVPQGGGTTLTSVWRYDPSTNAWEEVASMTAGRHGFLLCSF
jgi:N-acetylneuraminic acid mutarotase